MAYFTFLCTYYSSLIFLKKLQTFIYLNVIYNNEGMQFYFEIYLNFYLRIIPFFFAHHLEKDGSRLP
jgi:hypothetical protein